jgi:hypothetical protein
MWKKAAGNRTGPSQFWPRPNIVASRIGMPQSPLAPLTCGTHMSGSPSTSGQSPFLSRHAPEPSDLLPPLNASPSCKMRPPINSPRHPPSSPFASPQVHCKAVVESLAELHGICELARPNSPPSVNPAPPFPSHLSSFPLALLPNLFSSLYL